MLRLALICLFLTEDVQWITCGRCVRCSCHSPVSMRLRRLLSTTAARLSMCFCSVSSAASSLSTYWLVSCRHWPQAASRTHTHEHTQDEWPTATERGMEMEEDKKKKKKKVKGLERGQRNGKRNAEGSQSSKWFVYNGFKVIQSLLQPWVMLMTFVWFDLRVTVVGKSKEEKKHEARNE